MHACRSLLAILLALNASAAPAQAQGANQPRPLFRANANLVVCQATVSNSRHQPVTDLPESAFTVYDNGASRPIQHFAHENVPVSLGLVIDNSGGMADKRTHVLSAALSIAQSSNPRDEVFVVNFNEEAFLDNPGGQDFLQGPAQIAQALQRVSAQGGDAVRDAIAKSLKHIRKAHQERKALVVITNGKDTSSVLTPDELLHRVEAVNAIVYVIAFLNKATCGQDLPATKRFLNRVAETSGGRAFFPKDGPGIEQAASEISRDLRQQYVIAFAPAPGPRDDSPHQIKIVAQGEASYIVRTRAVYRIDSETTK